MRTSVKHSARNVKTNTALVMSDIYGICCYLRDKVASTNNIHKTQNTQVSSARGRNNVVFWKNLHPGRSFPKTHVFSGLKICLDTDERLNVCEKTPTYVWTRPQIWNAHLGVKTESAFGPNLATCQKCSLFPGDF